MSSFKYTLQHGLFVLQDWETKYVRPSCGQRTTDAFSKITGGLFLLARAFQTTRSRIVLMTFILTLSKFGISTIPLKYDLVCYHVFIMD